MKEKIKKNWINISRTIVSIIAVIWIWDEVDYSTDLSDIVGIMVMWGIVMYLLKIYERKN